jgi:16S rRNA (uracil1498-N3)-methyltransferase
MTRIHLDAPLLADTELPLPDAAHRHLVQVLRLRDGDALTVFDGQGVEAAATLTAVDKRSSRVRIGALSRPLRESPLSITLLQGVSKGDRMDYTLQKAVELGVTRIQPLSTRRSVVRLDAERWAKKYEHWQGVIVSACAQSGRTAIPPLLPVQSLDAALASLPAGLRTLALLPDDGVALRTLAPPTAGVALIVGPEGGLDDAEIAACRAAGCTAVQLGPRVLRTETAGVATLAALQALWGDWGPIAS